MHIRLLGAPGTGKTRLAAELTQALSAGLHAALAFSIHDDPALSAHGENTSACTTLLMGLDLPAPPAFAALQRAADGALRNTLAQSGVNYQVVYGQGAERLRCALSAVQGAGLAAAERDGHTRWVWACDTCSDPQCERRLLSALINARSG